MPSIPSPRVNKRPRIEVIPLIDIMFFLLATFMMVSLQMVKNEGVPVRLPVAASGEKQPRTDHVSITVTEMGTFYYNKEAVDREALAVRLAQLKREQPDPKVFINGDANAAFERVVAVLDETRKAGITKVAIETSKGNQASGVRSQP